MGEDGEPGGPGGLDEEFVDLLGDEYVWAILAETREKPRSVETLSERCDVHSSTIYRRVERLQEAGLLESRQRLHPDGHHHRVFSACLRELRIRLDGDGITVEVDSQTEKSAADRFTRLYEGFK